MRTSLVFIALRAKSFTCARQQQQGSALAPGGTRLPSPSTRVAAAGGESRVAAAAPLSCRQPAPRWAGHRAVRLARAVRQGRAGCGRRWEGGRFFTAAVGAALLAGRQPALLRVRTTLMALGARFLNVAPCSALCMLMVNSRVTSVAPLRVFTIAAMCGRVAAQSAPRSAGQGKALLSGQATWWSQALRPHTDARGCQASLTAAAGCTEHAHECVGRGGLRQPLQPPPWPGRDAPSCAVA